MPYAGVPASGTANMERCVAHVLGRKLKKFPGRTRKESAIAICKTSLGFTKKGTKKVARQKAAAGLARKL